jgi:adenylate cyclase
MARKSERHGEVEDAARIGWAAILHDRAALVRRARLTTGLILFAYVTTHLANHTLGLISLHAHEVARVWVFAVWGSLVGTVALYGSLGTHLALGFYALYRRQRLKMPRWEAAQLILGLAIPPLLMGHIIGTRLAYELYGLQNTYTYVDLVLWVFAPEKLWQQIAVLVVAWVHGTIGMHFWLRLKPGYRRVLPLVYAFALLLPVVALLGFVEGGREVRELAASPDWLATAVEAIHFPADADVAFLLWLTDILFYGYFGLLAAVLAARMARAWWQRSRGMTRISYPDGRVVENPPGVTVLEASRGAGIPHASVCGGRGRCSTCRVRVGAGLDSQPPPSEDEQKVLARISAPPNVRLACQLRPSSDIEVTPLLPPQSGPRAAGARPPHLQGEEREIAVLFADLRAFTELSEQKLPYDVVFLLNRYFETMGHAIEAAGGHVDKFIGDGIMALFGVTDRPRTASRQAIVAARAMADRLAELNVTMKSDLEKPLRIGIGIHVGPAIVGEMGYASTTSLTAVGDTVNTASRLEALSKTYQAELVLSEQVALRAGMALDGFGRDDVVIRGRREPMRIIIVPAAATLPAPE